MRRGSAFFVSALLVAALLLPPIAQAGVTLSTGRDLSAEISFPVIGRVVTARSGDPVLIDWQNFNIELGGNVHWEQPAATRGVLPLDGGDLRLAGTGISYVLGAPELPLFSISPVPEPSSWSLLFAGALLLVGVARRRFRNLP